MRDWEAGGNAEVKVKNIVRDTITSLDSVIFICKRLCRQASSHPYWRDSLARGKICVNIFDDEQSLQLLD